MLSKVEPIRLRLYGSKQKSEMDTIAMYAFHYFLSFFKLIGMDSVVTLFDTNDAFSDAQWCTSDPSRCEQFVWHGYALLVIVNKLL